MLVLSSACLVGELGWTDLDSGEDQQHHKITFYIRSRLIHNPDA